MKRLLCAALLAFALLLILAETTSANDLHQKVPIVGTHYGASDCSDGQGPGWAFDNTGARDATDAVLVATFLHMGSGHVAGYMSDDGTVHYFVPISPTDTLLKAFDSLDTSGVLVLTHVCTGAPLPAVTMPPSDTLAATSPSGDGRSLFLVALGGSFVALLVLPRSRKTPLLKRTLSPVEAQSSPITGLRGATGLSDRCRRAHGGSERVRR